MSITTTSSTNKDWTGSHHNLYFDVLVWIDIIVYLQCCLWTLWVQPLYWDALMHKYTQHRRTPHLAVSCGSCIVFCERWNRDLKDDQPVSCRKRGRDRDFHLEGSDVSSSQRQQGKSLLSHVTLVLYFDTALFLCSTSTSSIVYLVQTDWCLIRFPPQIKGSIDLWLEFDWQRSPRRLTHFKEVAESVAPLIEMSPAVSTHALSDASLQRQPSSVHCNELIWKASSVTLGRSVYHSHLDGNISTAFGLIARK